jgi:hypothetical protein
VNLRLEIEYVLEVLLPIHASPELHSSLADLQLLRMLQRQRHQVLHFVEGYLFLEGPHHQLAHAVEAEYVCDADPPMIGRPHEGFEVGVSDEIGHGEVELQLGADLLQQLLLHVGEGPPDQLSLVAWGRHQSILYYKAV